MAVFRIPDEHVFPNPRLADPSGLLGVGGDLHPKRILLAYREGIFPWYSPGQPILWWSPDPRMVLPINELHVPRSLRKSIRKQTFRITLDTAFNQVVAACASAYRPDQEGTWITRDMQAAYCELHRLGHAHSAEAWVGDELVGGLYGVALGGLFSGESMFSKQTEASKVTFVHLIHQLRAWGFRLVDCQVHTNHLARFGATEISRIDYLRAMEEALNQPGRLGKWQFEQDFEYEG